MIEFLLSLRRLPLIILAALLVILAGCLASGPAVVNVSPEATASLADPTSAPATAEPTLTATQLPVNTATPRAKPTLTATQPTVKIATVTPRADLLVAPAKGALAPALTLTDLNGDEVSLSDLQGKTVLLNFWTTWWPFCRKERSALQKAYEQYQDQGLVILAVDIGEEQGTVKAFTQEQGLTFPTLLDKNGDIARIYRVQGIPTTFFIDREGVIQTQHIGPLNESLIEEYLDQIL